MWQPKVRRYYHRRRDALVEKLGGMCAYLKKYKNHTCKGDLEVDHVDGVTWDMSKVSSHQRVRKLEIELENGVRLRLLCRKANRSLNRRRG